MTLNPAAWPQVETRSWIDNLRRGRCFVASATSGVTSGQYAQIALGLPSTATVEAVVVELIVSVLSADEVFITTGPVATAVGTGTIANASLGGPTAAMTVTTGYSTSGPKTAYIAPLLSANSPTRLLYGYGLGVSPGTSILLWSQSPDVSFQLTAWWMEGG